MTMIHRPIFIIGASRSGTTLLYHLMAVHPDICWFSLITDSSPSYPQLSFVHRILDIPIVGPILKKKIISATKGVDIFISPTEGPKIYDDVCGFTNANKATERNLTKKMSNTFKSIISNHLLYTGKTRFLNKKPENIQRLRLINAIFPDAIIIHIIRDGRGVVNSLLKSHWWPDTELWWFKGYKPSETHKHKLNQIELSSNHWLRNVEEVYATKELFGNRYIEVRYEELVRDIHGTISTILKFCELKQDTAYYSLLPRSYPSMNNKWKSEMTTSQKKVMKKILVQTLHKFGYDQ